MAEAFSVAFEQVEVVDGLAADQAVWLYMRATLRDAGNLDVALDVREVGAFPDDANLGVPDGYAHGDAGLFASSLPIAVSVRNDLPANGTGQVFPRFATDPIEVADGQVLDVEVFLVPKVWFREISVSPDELDKWSRTGFLTLLGASGFGLPGIVIGAVLGWLWGDSDQDVTVPCTQTVVSSRHLFTLDDLLAIKAEGMRRYGPNENDASICGEINSFYWLSVNQHIPYSFGTSQPVEPQDCQLNPWRHEPVKEWLNATWLDRDSWQTSCIGVIVDVTTSDTANVSIYDHASAPSAPRMFTHRPIVRELVPNAYSYNYFVDGCPPRRAVPVCSMCKRFSNVAHVILLPARFLAALAMGPRHVGAEGWGESLMRASVTAPTPGCTETARRRRLSGTSGVGEVAPLAPGTLYRRLGRDAVAMWPTGTPPPSRLRTHKRELKLQVGSSDPAGAILDALFGCFKVVLSEHEALYTYAEVPSRGEPQCPRLRYVRWNQSGAIEVDAMLQVWVRPPA